MKKRTKKNTLAKNIFNKINLFFSSLKKRWLLKNSSKKSPRIKKLSSSRKIISPLKKNTKTSHIRVWLVKLKNINIAKKTKMIIGLLLLFILTISTFFIMQKNKENAEKEKNAEISHVLTPSSDPKKLIDSDSTNEDLPPNSEILFQGRFVDVEQDLSGVALFIKSGEEKFLRFEKFSTANGQDIHAYLSPILMLDKNNVIDLGIIKATSGNFNYALDKSVDIGKYNNVLIWSNTFDAFFGYVSLTSKDLPEILESPTPQIETETKTEKTSNEEVSESNKNTEVEVTPKPENIETPQQ
ncbi:MAG: DM13 domain-containing protein [Candidatus Moraniibacteriota bacterium]